MSRGILCVVVTASLCVCTAGCFVTSDTSTGPQLPTVGRELSDLKDARDEGALSAEEYDSAKQRVLKRLDKPAKG